MTAKGRWPDFLVIGAYKSGTSALHHALRQHPGVFVPKKQEPNFFAFADGAATTNPAASRSVALEKDYLRLFCRARPDAVVGEVSPEYMANPAACTRIAATVPEVRLIAVLRNPIERAYSDYLMYRRDGDEHCARFGDALDQQDERYARGDPTGYYVRTGFYAAHLRPYFDRFPRERLHVLLYDDLRADQQRALAGVFGFLGVDPAFTPNDLAPVNISGVPNTRTAAAALAVRRRLRGVLRPLLPEAVKLRANRAIQRSLHRPELEAADRARLAELYRVDVTELGRLLDRDLSHWLRN
jgi:hypothetical protein